MTKIELKKPSGKLFFTLEYDEVNQWYYSNWIGFVTPEEIKAGANQYIEVIKKAGSPYVLNDNRQQDGPWVGVNEWLANDWTPRAIQAGLRSFAHILSPRLFSAVSAKDMETRVSGLAIRLFADAEEAKEWLRQEQKQNNAIAGKLLR